MTYLFLKNNPKLFAKEPQPIQNGSGFIWFKYSCRAYNYISSEINYLYTPYESIFEDLCGVASSVYSFRIKRNSYYVVLNALYPCHLFIPDGWVADNRGSNSECLLKTFDMDFLFELKNYAKNIKMFVSEFFIESCCAIGTKVTFKLF